MFAWTAQALGAHVQTFKETAAPRVKLKVLADRARREPRPAAREMQEITMSLLTSR